jgi:hypothetical protein
MTHPRPLSLSLRRAAALAGVLGALAACGPTDQPSPVETPLTGTPPGNETTVVLPPMDPPPVDKPGSLPVDPEDGEEPVVIGPTEPGEPVDPEKPAVEPLLALDACKTGILSQFRESTALMTARGSGAYKVPSNAQLATLKRSFDAFLKGDAAAAKSNAAAVGYTLCRGTGAEATLAFWQPPSMQGQAMVALRTGPARPVILETPHPFYDGGTVEEGAIVFRRTQARALISAGTHRCANAESAGCDGTTNACGNGLPYKISDMAHTAQSAFQVAHVALSEHFGDDWVLQLHGMAAAGASISDGTTLPTTSVSPSARVAQGLAKAFSGVTTCNAFGSFPKRNHMCGTSSTQGRHLNGSPEVCRTGVNETSGRFIHMEQSSALRGAPEKVAEALAGVLPEAAPAVAQEQP